MAPDVDERWRDFCRSQRDQDPERFATPSDVLRYLIDFALAHGLPGTGMATTVAVGKEGQKLILSSYELILIQLKVADLMARAHGEFIRANQEGHSPVYVEHKAALRALEVVQDLYPDLLQGVRAASPDK